MFARMKRFAAIDVALSVIHLYVPQLLPPVPMLCRWRGQSTALSLETTPFLNTSGLYKMFSRPSMHRKQGLQTILKRPSLWAAQERRREIKEF